MDNVATFENIIRLLVDRYGPVQIHPDQVDDARRTDTPAGSVAVKRYQGNAPFMKEMARRNGWTCEKKGEKFVIKSREGHGQSPGAVVRGQGLRDGQSD